MHSGTFLFPNWQVEWENLKNLSWKITIQQTVEVIQRFGTDKSVPYAPAGRRPIHLPAKFQFGYMLSETGKHFVLFVFLHII